MKDSGHRASVVARLLFAVLLGGCFSRSNNDNGNPLGDGGVPDLGDRVCNPVQVGSTFVPEMDSGDATIPTATGGALADGSYHLTSSTYYPAAACAIDPTASNLVVSSSSASSGTTLSSRIDCIAPDPFGVLGSAAVIAFSATATEIQIYGTGACGSHIDVYDLD